MLKSAECSTLWMNSIIFFSTDHNLSLQIRFSLSLVDFRFNSALCREAVIHCKPLLEMLFEVLQEGLLKDKIDNCITVKPQNEIKSTGYFILHRH